MYEELAKVLDMLNIPTYVTDGRGCCVRRQELFDEVIDIAVSDALSETSVNYEDGYEAGHEDGWNEGYSAAKEDLGVEE